MGESGERVSGVMGNREYAGETEIRIVKIRYSDKHRKDCFL